MKTTNIFLSLLLAIILVGCEANKDISNRTHIEKNYCYEVQSLNEYGAAIPNEYQCMQYDTTYGNDFLSAYNHLQAEIEQRLAQLQRDYSGYEGWDGSKVELKQTECFVKNAPSSKLSYISLNFCVYNITPYNEYIVVLPYYVLDSEGNLYLRDSLKD